MGNKVLLRFSPKSSESTHYFSDTIGGNLTFFHEEGARRCLEAFVDELGIPFLETSAKDSISVEQAFLTMVGETKKK
ncbi:hypothetical protein REPUB_Repub15cG0136200 [Reevesia pubescens]